MKKLFLALSVAMLAIISCSKKETTEQGGSSVIEKRETYIDATSKTTWNYYSLSQNKVVGTGTESAEDNAKWFARTDWDFAINRYTIRTNSGAATSVKAQGGVYTFGADTAFDNITSLPSGISFVADKAITSEGMGGTTTTVKSTATVIVFKANDDGSLVMPPVYLPAPVYIFRTADGANCYKVFFNQYQNEDKVTGHIKFYSSHIK